jgi:hypothetical protein
MSHKGNKENELLDIKLRELEKRAEHLKQLRHEKNKKK